MVYSSTIFLMASNMFSITFDASAELVEIEKWWYSSTFPFICSSNCFFMLSDLSILIHWSSLVLLLIGIHHSLYWWFFFYIIAFFFLRFISMSLFCWPHAHQLASTLHNDDDDAWSLSQSSSSSHNDDDDSDDE